MLFLARISYDDTLVKLWLVLLVVVVVVLWEVLVLVEGVGIENDSVGCAL